MSVLLRIQFSACRPRMTGPEGLLALDMPLGLLTQCSAAIECGKLTVVDTWASARSLSWLLCCLNL